MCFAHLQSKRKSTKWIDKPQAFWYKTIFITTCELITPQSPRPNFGFKKSHQFQFSHMGTYLDLYKFWVRYEYCAKITGDYLIDLIATQISKWCQTKNKISDTHDILSSGSIGSNFRAINIILSFDIYPFKNDSFQRGQCLCLI